MSQLPHDIPQSDAVAPAGAAPLTAAELARLGSVVEFKSRSGMRVTCSWMGQVRRVWALLPADELPSMKVMRGEMLAAYWPGEESMPRGLTDCICFWADA